MGAAACWCFRGDPIFGRWGKKRGKLLFVGPLYHPGIIIEHIPGSFRSVCLLACHLISAFVLWLCQDKTVQEVLKEGVSGLDQSSRKLVLDCCFQWVASKMNHSDQIATSSATLADVMLLFVLEAE